MGGWLCKKVTTWRSRQQRQTRAPRRVVAQALKFEWLELEPHLEVPQYLSHSPCCFLLLGTVPNGVATANQD